MSATLHSGVNMAEAAKQEVVSVKVSGDFAKVLDTVAKQRGTDTVAASDAIAGTYVSRVNALRRYAKKQKIESATKKPVAKKVEKKAAPKKVEAKKPVVKKAAPVAQSNGPVASPPSA
jgi:hypothetical protein